MKRAWLGMVVGAALVSSALAQSKAQLPAVAGPAATPVKLFGVQLAQSCDAVRAGLTGAGLKESALAGDRLSALFTVARELPAPFTKTIGVRLTCGAPGGQASEVVVTLKAAMSDQPALRELALAVAPATGWRGMMFGHGNDQTLVVFQRIGMSPVPARAPS